MYGRVRGLLRGSGRSVELRDLRGIPGEGAIVSGQVTRQRDKADRQRFAFAPEIGEGQCEKGLDGAIQFVRGDTRFRGEQVNCFLRIAQVAHRTRQLDRRSSAAKARQAGIQGGAIERNSKVRMTRRVLRRTALEESDRAMRWQLRSQRVHPGHEGIGFAPIDRAPQLRNALFPG
jgi:hypothetical protein